MTIVGRRELDNPALGAAGGATLKTSIDTIYGVIGDDLVGRFKAYASIANSTVTTVRHNFGVAFADIRVHIYTGTTGNLTRVTSPTASGWTIIANVTNPKLEIDVTAPSSGGPHTFVVWVLHAPFAENLDALTDVDLTVAPSDGEALVYNLASTSWKPGASGDSSFKLSSVSGNALALKGGFLPLSDGREIATYDGAGALSTDHGTDLSLNLDTILGTTPANATAYYLYIDLDNLGSEVTFTDTGRKVLQVATSDQSTKLKLFTTVPSAVNRARYRYIGGLKSATTGNTWSGSGSAFWTAGAKLHDNSPLAISPVVYRLPKQAVSTPGTSGQVAWGHLKSAKSFRSGLTTAQVSYYNLAANANDGFGGGRNLTNNNTVPFTGTNIHGTASVIAAMVAASSHSFSSADTFFNGGDADFTADLICALTDWTPAAQMVLMGNDASATDRGWHVLVATNGDIQFNVPSSATTTTSTVIPNPGFVDTNFHHFAVRYVAATDTWTFYIDGKVVGTVVQAMRTVTVSIFRVGAYYTTATLFSTGRFEDFGYQKIAADDEEIQRLMSYRIDHNTGVAPEKQQWAATLFTRNATEDEGTWLVDKYDSNSAFVDFSELASTDQVEVSMADLSLNAAVVPASSPFDTTYTSAPTFPIAHGLTEVPLIELMAKDGSNDWHTIDAEGLVKADSTNLKGDLATVFSAGYTAVRVKAMVGVNPTGVSEASGTRTGLLKSENFEAFTTVKTSAYNAVRGDKIGTDSSGGIFTVTLPATPSVGDKVEIYDATESWALFNVTLGRNGSNINSAAADYTLDIAGKKVEAVYMSSAQGWRIYG